MRFHWGRSLIDRLVTERFLGSSNFCNFNQLNSFFQGAVDTATLETRIKVANPEDPEPSINLYVENQADPAMRLVSEMMILCGEVIATYGCCNNIPLPYRGQPQSNIDVSAFAHLPEGPVRSAAIVRIMRAAEIDFRKPVRHGILGLPGYVQFTSPIRRYMDLLAHYQVSLFHSCQCIDLMSEFQRVLLNIFHTFHCVS